MALGVKQYLQAVTYYSKMYDFFNENLFGGKLEKPVITISPDEKNKAYGWITRDRLWKENGNEGGMCELNLSAQFLNRTISEIAATLIHEMCHQWASVNGFQDTARSGSFHNKLFKEIAEDYGLNVEYVHGRGWATTSLKEKTEELLHSFTKVNPPTLIYREMPIKPKRVKDVSVRKYVCPDCEASVRATKAVNVLCGDCNQKMQEEKL
ncbi:MAG: SprT-like domain-containing protein [Clostridia bacterium]|nr:SprT-like domain-containing protein [Clostridia bacterium]